MKIIPLMIIVLCTVESIWANDGAFYVKGNQLIPITETNISVKKEILTLKKIANKYIEATVYYEFDNPGADKKLTVGFEAFSPTGDVDGTPKNGQHPNIRSFTVQLNNQTIPYNVAYVEDSTYIKNGIVKSKKLSEIKASITNVNEVNFYYVYHFQATFKKGMNIIKHNYQYDVSSGVDLLYDFEYVLTAANRWGNKQIDDFTLILDMGEFETFCINKGFFTQANQWQIKGIGKVNDLKAKDNVNEGVDALKFHIRKGTVVFQKMNFHPNGELFLYAQRYLGIENLKYIPFSYYQQENINEPKTTLDRKILKNLPFARRGYVFQNTDLKKYYEQLDWYTPDPNYTPNTEQLTETEKKWLEKWK